MTGRIEGAELCHRIDAAKQLVKYGSKDAAEFLAKYKGVPCGHSINGRPDPADPCSAAERSLVAVTLNAPPTLTRDFLTVLSGIDEFLMARLIRAQTVDGVTIIEFLDDVMQDRTDGFKTHHRIAAAKELIVHIVRDEQPAPTPREPEPSSPVIPAKSLPRIRYPSFGAGTQGRGGGRNRPTPLTLSHAKPSFPRRREPRGAVGPVTPQPTPLVPSPTHPSFPRKACPVPDTGREPSGAAGAVAPQPTPLVPSPTHPSFPRKREPSGAGPAAPQPTPLVPSLP